NLFRFKQKDFPRILRVLGLSKFVHTENQGKYTPEKAFIIFLYRLRYPFCLENVDHRIGREYSQISRVVAMVSLLFDKFRHLMCNGVGAWVSTFVAAAATVRAKTGEGRAAVSLLAHYNLAVRRRGTVCNVLWPQTCKWY
ncbi:unnamed protein product, partial [Discosporangium mesarthrocarpum]